MSPERLSYGSYLLVEELLALQRPVGTACGNDELLFIVMHQTSELWFKQVLRELDAVAHHLDDGESDKAALTLTRVNAIVRIVEAQVDVLETMTPLGFLGFRDRLKPASGFQSAQFREIEFLCGLREHAESLMQRLEVTSLERAELARRLAEPSLYERFRALLARAGYAVEPHANYIASLCAVYETTGTASGIGRLIESMTEFDAGIMRWRMRHVRMVERAIGWRGGTGGSAGAGYLHSTLERRMFPELWTFRTSIGS